MSKLSYCLIAIMGAALIFMGAVRGYQAYEKRAQELAEAEANDGTPFSFQHIPVSLAAPQGAEPNRPVPFNPAQSAIFLEEAPLSAEQRKQQAQETISSILADYQQDPELQRFNQDLFAATQGTASDLSALGGENLAALLKENPQIAQVVQQYMQNPNFAQTVKQIFANPQFVESIRQLQGAAAATQAQNAKKAE